MNKEICKYWDCGWCYHPMQNDHIYWNAGCKGIKKCPYSMGKQKDERMNCEHATTHCDMRNCLDCEHNEVQEKDERDIVVRLKEAGSTGLDMSPGDALCMEAAKEIENLRKKYQEIYGKFVFLNPERSF